MFLSSSVSRMNACRSRHFDPAFFVDLHRNFACHSISNFTINCQCWMDDKLIDSYVKIIFCYNWMSNVNFLIKKFFCCLFFDEWILKMSIRGGTMGKFCNCSDSRLWEFCQKFTLYRNLFKILKDFTIQIMYLWQKVKKITFGIQKILIFKVKLKLNVFKRFLKKSKFF